MIFTLNRQRSKSFVVCQTKTPICHHVRLTDSLYFVAVLRDCRFRAGVQPPGFPAAGYDRPGDAAGDTATTGRPVPAPHIQDNAKNAGRLGTMLPGNIIVSTHWQGLPWLDFRD